MIERWPKDECKNKLKFSISPNQYKKEKFPTH